VRGMRSAILNGAVKSAITQLPSPPRTQRTECGHDVTTDEKPAIGDFTELSESDCKRAPGTAHCRPDRSHGRGRPAILPVSYQYRNGSVIFRTSPVGPLAALVRRTSVAFEIDGIDEQNKSGWSVLVNGFAEAMAHDYLLTTAWETGPVPGADGARNLLIEIKTAQDQRPGGTGALANVRPRLA
jgi:Pyridoxamine 5'-phosphate oxidase